MANLASLTRGAAIVLPSETFDGRSCLRAIHSERCTAEYGVPSMFLAQVDHAEREVFDCTSMRTGVIAGAPCTSAAMHRIVRDLHIPELTVCYGMTEAPPITQSWPEDSLEERAATVGIVQPHMECRLMDPRSGACVPIGSEGEVSVRGYGVMVGYWGDEGATRAVVDADGWLRTGDLARMRADGVVVLSGRIKELIIRGGENIWPREVEECLMRHPKVEEAHVVGVPHDQYGEEVGAWIRLRAGEVATAKEIRAFCRRHSAAFRVPRHVCFVSHFPKTATGKVLKRELLTQILANKREATTGFHKDDI